MSLPFILPQSSSRKITIPVVDVMPESNSPYPGSSTTVSIEEVPLAGATLRANPPLCLAAVWCTEQSDYSIIRSDLGIHVFSQSSSGLLNELQELIPILWNEYAIASDNSLSSAGAPSKSEFVTSFSKIRPCHANSVKLKRDFAEKVFAEQSPTITFLSITR
jgi:hypothetical protein